MPNVVSIRLHAGSYQSCFVGACVQATGDKICCAGACVQATRDGSCSVGACVQATRDGICCVGACVQATRDKICCVGACVQATCRRQGERNQARDVTSRVQFRARRGSPEFADSRIVGRFKERSDGTGQQAHEGNNREARTSEMSPKT